MDMTELEVYGSPGGQEQHPGSVAGGLAEPFGVAAAAFGVQATVAGGSAWPSRSALWVRGSGRVVQDLLESSQGGLPVAPLRTMLSRNHGDHTAYQAALQRGQCPLTLRRRERRRFGQVERQLDARVRGVYRLTAWAAGTREPPAQLGSRDLDPANDERLHESMVTDPAARRLDAQSGCSLPLFTTICRRTYATNADTEGRER
jgi:hypothetical protein